MRHLVARELQDFFAHELGDDEPLGLVRDHVLRVVLRSLRQVLLDLLHEVREVHLLLRRDGHDPGKRIFRRVPRDNRQHILLLDEVQLVHDEDDRARRALQALEDVVLARPHLLRRIDDEQDGVHLFQRALRRLHHVLAELVARLVDARRVEEHDLRIRLRENAEDAVARRLRLVAHDGDFLPDERVDERGFPHIRPPDDRHKTRFMFTFCHIHHSLGIPNFSITNRCSFSISSRSASSMWSYPSRCSMPWTVRNATSRRTLWP